MLTTCHHILLLFIAIIFTTTHCQNIGESCTDNFGQTGTCILLMQCQEAIALVTSRKRPKICSFVNRRDPVACCVRGQSSLTIRTSTGTTTRTSPTTSTSTTPKPPQQCPVIAGVIDRKNGRKAWDKCIDISEIIYPCYRGYVGNHYERGNRCSHAHAILIIDGTPALKNEFPHMALLGYGEDDDIKWECGGTLISERWVMTAGHCLRSRDGPVKHIRLGSPNINDPIEPRLLYSVTRIVSHPEYAGSSKYNDIALLQTDREVIFSEFVIPACLHTGNAVNDTKLIATGWGATASHGEKSNVLMKVSLEKFSHSACSAKNPKSRKLKQGIKDETQLCAGHHTEKKDSCQGDSGGPLQIINMGVRCTYLIVGVTSYGIGCGTPGQPAVYTRVSAFVPWIESVVWS